MNFSISLFIGLLFIFSSFFSSFSVFAQSNKKIEKSASYHSPTDDLLSIRKISVYPVHDNVGGIYARPIKTKLIELLQSTHRWSYQASNIIGSIPSLEELEENPYKVKQLSANSGLDAFIVAKIIKGQLGVSVTLDLFLTKDGKLLAQSMFKKFKHFEIRLLSAEVEKLYRNLIQKLPYNGFVLSRTIENRVTINLGQQDGIRKGDDVSIIQILAINRHPKFNFIISSQKEILGKIRIYKVDQSLSFGSIISEKERGTILKGGKIYHQPSVAYDYFDPLNGIKTTHTVADKKDNSLAFDKDAQEWRPKRPPTFGKATMMLGIGSFNSKANLSSSGALEASTALYPQINLAGEIWLNPEWTVNAQLKQGIASTSNPLTGSSPADLSHSTSHYSVMVGYNFLLQENFFGPKIQTLIGISRYAANVDDSTPKGLTSAAYGGVTIGLKGEMPVTRDKVWRAGAHLNILIAPSLTETPVTSGANASSTVNDFGLSVSKQLTPHMLLTGALDFTLTRASFTGTGTRVGETASSISQQQTLISAGITYLF